MSFSNQVKSEICTSINSRNGRVACLYGILLFSKRFDTEEICFQTENSDVSSLFVKLCEEVFKKKVFFNRESVAKKNGTSVKNSFTLTDKKQIKHIFETFGLKKGERHINNFKIPHNSTGAFVAGAFLSCGSIVDPNKQYHLEFAVPEEQLSAELSMVLQVIDIKRREVKRKNYYIVYMKESEEIEDILTFMGAKQSRLDLSNIIILKDMINRVNRITNCDKANIDKQLKTAERQLDDIKLIIENDAMEDLPKELREVAEIRLNNPEYSLKEIGESLVKPIGRSGVTRRFAKISQFAEKYRK